jgi:hypothetical protein
MDVSKHERLSNISLRHKTKVKEQLVVRKDMNVNEHYKLFLYFSLCLSDMLDSLSCSFTSIFFLTSYKLFLYPHYT